MRFLFFLSAVAVLICALSFCGNSSKTIDHEKIASAGIVAPDSMRDAALRLRKECEARLERFEAKVGSIEKVRPVRSVSEGDPARYMGDNPPE